MQNAPSFTYDAFDPIETSKSLGLDGLIGFCHSFDFAQSNSSDKEKLALILTKRWKTREDLLSWELVFFLLSQGLFRAAVRIRRALEREVESQGSSLDRFALSVQKGNYDLAKGCLREIEHQGILPKGESFARLASCIPSGFTAYESTGSSSLLRRIGERKALIKGPSDNGAPESKYQASDFFVLTFNHVDFGPEEDRTSYALTVDGSIYSGTVACRFDAASPPARDSRVFRVFKYGSSSAVRSNCLSSGFGHQAIWSRYSQLHSSPNLLQISLCDLLARGISHISVIDNNLYINDVYRRGYSTRELQKKFTSFESRLRFAKHDPFANRDYLRGLFDVGLIDPDDVLHNILTMSDEEFGFRMEQEHGLDGRSCAIELLKQWYGDDLDFGGLE